jgi:hypothetical protein
LRTLTGLRSHPASLDGHSLRIAYEALTLSSLRARRVEDGGTGIAHRSGDGGRSHAGRLASSVLSLELSTTNILALSESDIDGFAGEHGTVHFGDGLGSIIGTREADETEAARVVLLVEHNLAGGDVADWLDGFALFGIVVALVVFL